MLVNKTQDLGGFLIPSDFGFALNTEIEHDYQKTAVWCHLATECRAALLVVLMYWSQPAAQRLSKGQSGRL